MSSTHTRRSSGAPRSPRRPLAWQTCARGPHNSRRPRPSPWRSSVRPACRSTAGSPSCPFIPARSKPRGPAMPPPAGVMPGMPSSRRTSRGPTATASGRSSRSPTRPVRCAPRSAPATIWPPSGGRSPISSARCRRASGPAPPRSSPPSTRPSPCSPAPPRRTVPSGSAKDALPPSLPGITPADVALSPTCWRASTTLPPPPAARLNKEAQGALVRAFVAVLGPLVRQPQHLHGAVEQAVAGHADGPIAPSLPRAGRVNAAQVLAEPGDDGGSAPTSTSPRKRALPR